MTASLTVMVGTSLDGRGGMSSVSAAYRDAGFFDSRHVVYLASHVEGSRGAKLRALAGALLRLWMLLLRGRVRLVHVHTASGLSFWRKSLFAATVLLFGRPLVLHVHGGEFERFHARLGWLGRAWLRGVFGRAGAVVVLSEAWVARLAPICPRARWLVLPNPVALRAAPARAAHPPEGVEVLFLGRLERAKGVFELIEAFAVARRTAPALRLVLAGEGDREGVLAQVDALGLAGHVRLVGWVAGEAKATWLDRCPVFALPSHIEGLPMAMLEAMSARAAVVVSRVGSIPEVVSHGVNGWLVPPGEVAPLAEALAALGNDPALRLRLADAARDTVERHYAVQRVCARLADIHDGVAPAGSSA